MAFPVNTAAQRCSADDDGVPCGYAVRSRGLCNAHYKRLLRNGGTSRVTTKGGATGTCTFPGCRKPRVARRLCVGHLRQRQLGRELSPLRPQHVSAEDFLLARRLLAESGCWLWTGALSTDGYARTNLKGRKILIHRLAYEVWVDALDGNTIHHKCGVRHCFNPDHLESASRRDNALEMHERRELRARIAALEAEVCELRRQLAGDG